LFITDDVRALMCDKCQSPDAWKCVSFLNLPTEVYDALIGANCSSLIYLCDNCEAPALRDTAPSCEHSDKMQDTLKDMSKSLTYLVTNDCHEEVKKMLQNLLEKLEVLDQTMIQKGDATTVLQLEKRM